MLIDARVWRPGSGGDGDPAEPPRRRALDVPWRAIGWTLVVIWLMVASVVSTSSLLGAGFAFAALTIAAWRGSRWMGDVSGGLREHRQ